MNEAIEGYQNEALKHVVEQARGAMLARRTTFVARLPMLDDLSDNQGGDVRYWSAAVEQIQLISNFELRGWSVVPEPDGPVAYAVFNKKDKH